MESYEKYKKSRDLAWEFLIDQGLYRFPINVKQIIERMGILLLPKEEYNNIYARTIFVKDEIIVQYQKRVPESKIRFSLAHELGHILRGHIEEQGINSYMEQEANIFASRLLMPLVVINYEKLDSTRKISKFFGVSDEAAELRLMRYNEVKNRNMFLKHPLERKYFENYLKSLN